MSNAKMKGAMGGAATGAAMGSAFGPWGTAVGAVGGGMLGFFGSGEQEELEKKKLQAMRRMGTAVGGYRDQSAVGHMNSLNNQMAAYNPANLAYQSLYGQGTAPDPTLMLRNPMTGKGPQVQQPGAPAPQQGMGTFFNSPKGRR